jgi:hypothetical protein
MIRKRESDWQCLSELIAGAGGSLASGGRMSRGPSDLLTEHLTVAQRCLLGNMRNEYRTSLELAMTSLSSIPDKMERARIRLVIRGLLKQIPV